jgi:hypothetical protein
MHYSHDASLILHEKNPPLTYHASFTYSKTGKGWEEGGLTCGGLFGKRQFTTTDFLNARSFKSLVASVIPVNAEHCHRIRYCLLADSFCVPVYTCPDCVGLGLACLVSIGDASESSRSFLQDLQGIGNSFIVFHINNVSDLDLGCKYNV